MAPLARCAKKDTFEWTTTAQRTFESIKERLCIAPILALPNFELLFEIDCDASGTEIGAVLTQAKRPLAYFSKKLSGSRLNYFTYDKGFYTIISALEYWNHYLNLKPFVLDSGHKALSYMNVQHKLNTRHAKWVEFL